MKSFQRAQLEFTQHLRDPLRNAAPQGVEDRRLGIYRDLVYNNIAGFIAGAFPVVKSILRDEQWQDMVRDFVAHHLSQTPYFLEISQEFLAYLGQERATNQQDPVFLLELAHYEWVELALDVAEEEIPPLSSLQLSVLDARLQVSVLAWPLAYQFPVHKIGASYQPVQPSETPIFLVAYRKRDDSVNFMEANAMTFGLLQLLQESEGVMTGRTALETIAQQIKPPNWQTFLAEGERILDQLVATEILVSFE